jgi:hypothetical protein
MRYLDCLSLCLDHTMTGLHEEDTLGYDDLPRPDFGVRHKTIIDPEPFKPESRPVFVRLDR